MSRTYPKATIQPADVITPDALNDEIQGVSTALNTLGHHNVGQISNGTPFATGCLVREAHTTTSANVDIDREDFGRGWFVVPGFSLTFTTDHDAAVRVMFNGTIRRYIDPDSNLKTAWQARLDLDGIPVMTGPQIWVERYAQELAAMVPTPAGAHVLTLALRALPYVDTDGPTTTTNFRIEHPSTLQAVARFG